MDNSVDTDPTEYAHGDYGHEAKGNLQPIEIVNKLVKDNRIVIFSKSHCPYCDHSKSLLSNLGLEYKAVELDKMMEGSELQNTLGEMTDARTVPRIFIDGHCVGGNSELQNLNSSGELINRVMKKNNVSSTTLQ